MNFAGQEFREVVFEDTEFRGGDGNQQEVVCVVAHELGSGRTYRLFADELAGTNVPPYAHGPDVLHVAYYSSAEVGSRLALGWPEPEQMLDLFAEFKNRTNGLRRPCGAGLLGAAAGYGVATISATEKDSMRDLVLRGGPWSDKERASILDYCESDVRVLRQLAPRMEGDIDLPRALLRGRYMRAAAHIERLGIPVDVEALAELRANWDQIKDELIRRIDSDYGVYDGSTFKADRFEAWLVRAGIPWPLLESGRLAMDDDTFREMAKVHPVVAPLRELRYTLSKLRLSGLTVGEDGRNRCLLSAFGSSTGRNQPSNSKFIFGPAVWLRHLIRPDEGMGLAYIDYEQQEFGIAAALSGDSSMLEAYTSGDPYLRFAQQAGAAPPEATKSSHREVREKFKRCALAVLYGMGAASLGGSLDIPDIEARQLLDLHRRTYPTFWSWSDALIEQAMLANELSTVFGWRLQLATDPNGTPPRIPALRNFPAQANGAEMLRLACCFATERGIRVCAPVHDAILIEAPLDQLDDAVAAARKAMEDASDVVLAGLRLRTDVKTVRYPDRYEDERGIAMWNTVQGLIRELNERRRTGP